jgi:hypothetical protein
VQNPEEYKISEEIGALVLKVEMWNLNFLQNAGM